MGALSPLVDILTTISFIYAILFRKAQNTSPFIYYSILLLVFLLFILQKTTKEPGRKTKLSVFAFLLATTGFLITGGFHSSLSLMLPFLLFNTALNASIFPVLLTSIVFIFAINISILFDDSVRSLFFTINSLGLTVALGSLFLSRSKSTTIPSTMPPESQEKEKAKSTIQEETRKTYDPDALIKFHTRIRRSSTLEEVFEVLVNFLSEETGIDQIVVYFDSIETFYHFKLISHQLVSTNITSNIDYELRNPPDTFQYEDTVFYQITKLPEGIIYLPEILLSDEQQPYIKLACDLAAYRAIELNLKESEKQLLNRFNSIYSTSKKISTVQDLRPIIESAAEAVKTMTGMQKSIVCLCSSPDEIEVAFNDKTKTIVKGIMEEHPEKMWAKTFLKISENALEIEKPVLATFSESKLTMLCIPIIYQNKKYGVLAGITSLNKEEARKDLKTMEIISSMIASALNNLEIIRKREEYAVTIERDRIAREMHDNLIQTLFSLLLAIETISRRSDITKESLQEEINEIKLRLQKAIQETRESIMSLYPKALSEHGLLSTINRYLTNYQEVRFSLESDAIPENLSLNVENAILRIIQESVSNAVRHGKATEIDIALKSQDNSIYLRISDNGSGFDASEVDKIINSGEHFGFNSMFERVKEFNGEINITSKPGHGTVIEVIFPQFVDSENER